MQVKSVFLQQALLKEYRALDHEVLKADYYDSDQVRTLSAKPSWCRALPPPGAK